ncbi:hypothetical protein IGI37_003019 [Enterococcus sp. AZ194]|uniref:hypothetical protein n=1 Tax=Enterococcus sp. AZ194 TaxID=2774629 RepID=UPI003F297FAB
MSSFVAPLKQEIQEAAQNYVQQKIVQPLHYKGYISYVDTGNRKTFEKEYFARRRQLATLALAAYDNEDPATLNVLSDVIWEICNEFTWAVPAHLPTQVKTLFNQATPCVDLFAAETGQALSEIKHLLGHRFDPWLLHRIDYEIDKRIFQPFLSQTWFWETSGNNWSAVVAGSIGMAALYQLEKNSSFQQEILGKVALCMQTYLDSFQEDGACLEGVGYWAYGFGYYIYFAELYKRILGDSHYLTGSKIKRIASFPHAVMLTNKQFVLFSDYTQSLLPTGLLTFCKEHLGVPIPPVVTPNHLDDDHCYRFAHIMRNVHWAKEKIGDSLSEGVTYLQDAQWLFVRDSQSQCFLAAKAGSNEESHNHNDVGHLIAGMNQTIFLTDLGAGEYVKSYFQEERYEFLVTSSKGHSVPVINGQYQRAGNYRAHQVFQEDSHLEMEISEVYPKEAGVNKYIRKIECELSKNKSRIVDYFEFSHKKNHLVENFVTFYEPQINQCSVTLTTAESTCCLAFETDKLTILAVEYPSHDAQTKTAYLIQASYELEQKAEIEVNITFESTH